MYASWFVSAASARLKEKEYDAFLSIWCAPLAETLRFMNEPKCLP